MESTTVSSPAGLPPVTVQQADDLAAFRRLVSSSFVPLEVSGEADRGFTACLRTAEGDGIAFTEVSAAPHVVERTPATIEHGGAGYYKLSLMLSGCSILVQDGRELVMGPGELAIYDTSRPYSLLQTETFRDLIVMFPKDRLDLPAPFVEQLTGVSLREQHGALAQVLSAYLSQFPEQLGQLDDVRLRAKLARTGLDLVGTMLAAILDTDAVSRDPHRLLLQKICGYIDEHLASPELSPSSIAAAHFVSTRHLHALFTQAGTTVSTWVRERRLERCRADLFDPLLADRAIAAIAARWGFADAAHFSRVFKAAYGVSPSELRHAGV